MANEFNANDIFEMAIQIEKNGAKFYRDAASKIENQANKDFLLDLASMEDSHGKIFAGLQNELSKSDTFSTVFDPDDENALYLKALADMRVFFKKDDPGDDFGKIIGTAVQAEKDSIVFYLGMKNFVPQKAGKDKLDDIIMEEMGHIRVLAEKIESLK